MNIDFLGFIFYEKSPRYVLNHLTLEDISKIGHRGKTGVFVNKSIEKVAETAEKSGLNFIQLHGDEDEIYISKLKEKLNPRIGIIKAIRIGNQETGTENKIQQATSQLLSAVNYFLFDTDSKAFGGTGKQFDWNILNDIELPLPYFLSGGISEDNIDKIGILNQNPFALDINSKFETEPGIKDLEKIKAFKGKLQ
ncbi:phosphoribosylanthranilate isomerase [Chryseobacterium defluvii]|uniref:N-(5'-phosphoribosyl)anthranilate isomerase n=2 Tax=Chryseobacterium defluvii TaxID=160396 RepID=A0A840KAT1_9FLAO|nr:phosphoribosylanthranilate isomerase [Chryseobacterium defluvii]